jgi:hypothetical protein
VSRTSCKQYGKKQHKKLITILFLEQTSTLDDLQAIIRKDIPKQTIPTNSQVWK